MAKPKTSQKTQTTNGVSSNGTLRPHIAAPQRPEFVDLADSLATALANVLEHEDCPEYLAARIESLHAGIVSEFNVEVAADIRLRFADACVYAAENRRPAD